MDKSTTTYRYDRLRAPFSGMLEASWTTFGLLIAIRIYDAPVWLKSTISSAGFLGLLLNIFVIALASRTAKTASQLITFNFGFAALCLFLSGLWGNLYLFAGFFILAQIANAQNATPYSQITSANYSRKERGKRLSSVLMFSAVGGILFSYFGGNFLDQDITRYPIILWLMMLAAAIAAWAASKIPALTIDQKSSGNPWKSTQLIWQDRLFGWMLLCWMLMGLGNLMLLPLRVEYLANPLYKINASNELIAVIIVVVPTVARLVSTKIWGYFYDKVHFITWRIAINLCFIAGFLIFFHSTHPVFLALGTVFSGIAIGGGSIAWNLWVTKIAPPEKVPAYMSIHTLTTGLRGACAPFLGYWLIVSYDPRGISYIASGLVLLASVMFAFVKKSQRFEHF